MKEAQAFEYRGLNVVPSYKSKHGSGQRCQTVQGWVIQVPGLPVSDSYSLWNASRKAAREAIDKRWEQWNAGSSNRQSAVAIALIKLWGRNANHDAVEAQQREQEQLRATADLEHRQKRQWEADALSACYGMPAPKDDVEKLRTLAAHVLNVAKYATPEFQHVIEFALELKARLAVDYRISFNGIVTDHKFICDAEAFSYTEGMSDTAAMPLLEKKLGDQWFVWDAKTESFVIPAELTD